MENYCKIGFVFGVFSLWVPLFYLVSKLFQVVIDFQGKMKEVIVLQFQYNKFDLLEILDGGVTPVQKEDVFYFL